MTETTKIIQSLCFLLSKIKRADKLTLIKLLFLADKYHLIRYGRTVTSDEYWAMPIGPVGTLAKNILSLDEFLSKKELKYIQENLKKISEHEFEKGNSCGLDEFDMLSETDIEALDFIIQKFGKMKKRDLIKYTHEYPEWKQYEKLFERNETKRGKIGTEELLSTFKNDCLSMPVEHMNHSRRILMGTHD